MAILQHLGFYLLLLFYWGNFAIPILLAINSFVLAIGGK
jgi:hypothetical protein